MNRKLLCELRIKQMRRSGRTGEVGIDRKDRGEQEEEE